MANVTFDPSLRPFDQAGIRRRRIVKYTGPKSYVTGGDPIAAGDVDLGVIEDVSENIAYNPTTPAIFFIAFDQSVAAGGPTGGKLRWFSATATEVAPGTDLSGATSIIEFLGR